MEIMVSQEQGRVPVTVFRLKGPVIETEQLQERARVAFDAGTRNLVLDLSEVPYMASPGLRALHHVYTLLRATSADENDDTVQQGIAAGTYKTPHLKLINTPRDVLERLSTNRCAKFLEVHKK